MKTYQTTPPKIDGILSDDNLYFEGVNRPQIIYAIRDQKKITEDDIDVLVKYFNDIYNLFLRKLGTFAMFEKIDDDDAVKLQALLQELIKVKGIINGSGMNKDESLI